ncbi:MAG: hypothetical protein KF752_04250 [Pirellulaceae bacterium]|nr:hypothetical protein [Pirellulaceae bacterium]
MSFDADAIIDELDELEEHLTGHSRSLAKAAFQRVFESITLYWEKVSPRRRELVRAEIVPRFPFCLTVNTLRQSSAVASGSVMVHNFQGVWCEPSTRITKSADGMSFACGCWLRWKACKSESPIFFAF